MRTILKILCAPAMVVMWLVIRAGVAVTYVSGLILSIISAIAVRKWQTAAPLKARPGFPTKCRKVKRHL